MPPVALAGLTYRQTIFLSGLTSNTTPPNPVLMSVSPLGNR